MAYQKSKTVRGHISNYWRIIQVNIQPGQPPTVNVTVGLYKDLAERNANQHSIVHQWSINLGTPFMNRTPTMDGTETIKSAILRMAYAALTNRATAEAAKPVDEQNANLAYLADATEV